MQEDTEASTDGMEVGEWYWDRRTNKAYYAEAVDDETTRLVTVWHREEAASALETGAVVPLEELSSGGTATMDLVDSFRTPDDLSGGEDA